jgi:phosphate-selective porin OprO/OprP
MYSPEKNEVLHVGINYRYGEPEDDKIKVRSRPEANPAPRFIDTGDFSSNQSNHFGTEIYYNAGLLDVRIRNVLASF